MRTRTKPMVNKKLFSKDFRKLLGEAIPPAQDPTPKGNLVGPVDPSSSNLPQNISLDQKVDRLLMQYEKQAGPNPTAVGPTTSDKQMPNLPENKRIKQLARFLFEAPGDIDLGGGQNPALGGAGGGPGDLGGNDLGGGPDLGGGGDLDFGGDGPTDEENQVKREETKIPQINLQVFAQNLAQLVQNYDRLLDPKTVILNRAETYIRQNYSDNIAKELLLTLELNYGISAHRGMQTQYYDNQNNNGLGAAVGDLSASPSSGGTLTGNGGSGGGGGA